MVQMGAALIARVKEKQTLSPIDSYFPNFFTRAWYGKFQSISWQQQKYDKWKNRARKASILKRLQAYWEPGLASKRGSSYLFIASFFQTFFTRAWYGKLWKTKLKNQLAATANS